MGKLKFVSVKRYYIFLLVFTSGFSSLLYQISLNRLFNLTFGLFIHSTVVILVTYMVGLAIGYFVSRYIKPKNNLSFYGYLELIIGLYTLMVFIAFGFIDNLYTNLGNYILVKIVLSTVILLVPTTAMGITLPILVEYFRKNYDNDEIEKIYGINALGGSIGAFLTSILFINLLGLSATFLIGLALNVFVFWAALYLSEEKLASFKIQKTNLKFANIGMGMSLIVFLFGFSGMALEIIWYRLLVYFVANNTFSFSIILSVVILGIALGSLLHKPLVGVLRNDFYLLVTISFFTSFYLFLAIHILNNSYSVMGTIFNVVGNIIFTLFGDNKFSETITLTITRYFLVSITAGVVALSSGIVVPSVFSIVRKVTEKESDSQSISGTILSINTLGSIVGVILITYFIIPIFGFSNSIVLISFLYLISGFVVIAKMGFNKVLGTIGVIIASIVIFLPREITFTKYYNGFFDIKGDLKFYKEGMYGTIGIFDVNGVRFLKINGIDEVPNDFDSIVTFKMLGNLPFLISGSNSNIMVNALGGGITLSSVLSHVSTQKVYVVDICPDVISALPFYKGYNDNVFLKTNWVFVEDDGRNFLKSHRETFDIIIADATHPASSESWILFTKEFYNLIYSKLKTDGVFAQWIPVHNLETYDFVSILKTIQSVFPNALLFITGVYTIVVGKKSTSEIEFKNSHQEDLSVIGMSFDDVKSLLFLTPEQFRKLVSTEKGEILHDYKSSVEFAEFHRRFAEDTKSKNFEVILKYSISEELSEFTGISIDKHKSMILAKQGLINYMRKLHYDALLKLEEALKLDERNFYARYLFLKVFREFVDIVYKYEKQIRATYGDETYKSLVRYIETRMKFIDKLK
ncbi:MAG: fused MFS/spermidine synthase [Brevinematales bacterium]|nr:fused MFS/spermidine synthase [Brevinematales bacterium]